MKGTLLLLLFLLTGTGTAPAQERTPKAQLPLITTVDHRDLERIRSALRGKVILLNIWATWCAPCGEEFPELLKLRTAYRPKGLEVLFVSVDNVKVRDRAVRSFLTRSGVDFETYLKARGDDEAFISALSPKWSGALPATFVYARNGSLAELRLEQVSYEELEELIRSLLHP